jgi:hypothetical protein
MLVIVVHVRRVLVRVLDAVVDVRDQEQRAGLARSCAGDRCPPKKFTILVSMWR